MFASEKYKLVCYLMHKGISNEIAKASKYETEHEHMAQLSIIHICILNMNFLYIIVLSPANIPRDQSESGGGFS